MRASLIGYGPMPRSRVRTWQVPTAPRDRLRVEDVARVLREARLPILKWHAPDRVRSNAGGSGDGRAQGLSEPEAVGNLATNPRPAGEMMPWPSEVLNLRRRPGSLHLQGVLLVWGNWRSDNDSLPCREGAFADSDASEGPGLLKDRG